MKIVIALLLLAAVGTCCADEVSERMAWGRSTKIVEKITQGEIDLKKAVGYRDEAGYDEEVTRHLVRQLQWWREEQALYPRAFEPYGSCVSAGGAFNNYASAVWSPPSLRRDREMRELQARYLSELKACQRVLKQLANRAPRATSFN